MSLDRVWGKIVVQYLKDSFDSIKGLFNKSHAVNGVYFLSGTSISTEGNYYGFVVTGESTVIDSINYINPTKQRGDITTITLPQGLYVSIPGNFRTITLTSGNMILLSN